MRKSLPIFLALAAQISAAYGVSFPSTTQSMSKYGQIQNVQNYSTNPFWNSNSPYNQRMPQPIYATGTDLSTGDCQRTVANLIAQVCATRNNCIGAQISDIRPTVMVQLSQLPGHNYASSCGGYIDTAFAEYQSTHFAAAPSASASFPAATISFPSTGNTATTTQAQKLPTWNGQPWAAEMLERKAQVAALNAQSNNGVVPLSVTDFPETAADYSLAERTEYLRAGYEPFKDASAYKQIKIEDEETYVARLKEQNYDAWCKYRPAECLKEKKEAEQKQYEEDLRRRQQELALREHKEKLGGGNAPAASSDLISAEEVQSIYNRIQELLKQAQGA